MGRAVGWMSPLALEGVDDAKVEHLSGLALATGLAQLVCSTIRILSHWAGG